MTDEEIKAETQRLPARNASRLLSADFLAQLPR